MSPSALRRFAAVAALALAALAAGHELVYLVSHGPGAGYASAMREGGHDRYWTSFVLTVLAVTAGLVGVVATQLRRLRRLAATASVAGADVTDGGVRRLLDLLGALWVRVALITSIGYVVQENVEGASAGATLPGLGVVGGEHIVALPILMLVSLVVAAVGALVGWRREVLLARLRARTAFRPRRAGAIRLSIAAELPHPPAEPRRNGVRAPPAMALQTT